MGDKKMIKGKWKTYGLWILFTEVVGALSGFISREGMKVYEETVVQPPLSPPMFLFPIVWGLLYALLGFSVARIWMAPASPERSKGLNLYFSQLILNFFWSPIFFNAGAYGLALIWLIILWVLVYAMIRSFRKVDPLAGNLQIPYLLWLTFATYLTFGVWYLNP